jgi:anthranilate synthase component 1
MDPLTSQLQPETFAEFAQEARRGNVVAVVRTFTSEALDPVDAFVNVAGSSRYAFLFESVEGGEAVANYSFLGADPYMVVRGRGEQTIIQHLGIEHTGAREKADTQETRDQNVTEFLRDHFRQNKLASRPGLVPLAGGAVGYLGYGAARWFEPALNKHRLVKADYTQSDEYKSEDALLMFYRTVVVFDRAQREVKIITVVFTDEAAGSEVHLKELYQSAVQNTERIAKLLALPTPVLQHLPSGETTDHQMREQAVTEINKATVRSNWTRENFEQAVLEMKEHIMAGDCYQVVLSQRFSRQVTVGPVPIYRALRWSNPAPYTYLLKLGSEAIIGASPEMLVRCRGERLNYRPIAGTRKRGATEAEDDLLAEEMRADEKEVAEHMMLVDLGRNDLGRVAEFGSVKVEDLMSVERYSKVQHLVSSLSARLRPGCDRFDALAACFPAGTVTGAPKVRAMEIIRELESDERGVYAGAVLYADYADNLDSCIAIRTILLRQGEASVQAGAGIVADSVPEREYQETLDKAHALLRAIELAEENLAADTRR